MRIEGLAANAVSMMVVGIEIVTLDTGGRRGIRRNAVMRFGHYISRRIGYDLLYLRHIHLAVTGYRRRSRERDNDDTKKFSHKS